jgi:hypothetical protein
MAESVKKGARITGADRQRRNRGVEEGLSGEPDVVAEAEPTEGGEMPADAGDAPIERLFTRTLVGYSSIPGANNVSVEPDVSVKPGK